MEQANAYLLERSIFRLSIFFTIDQINFCSFDRFRFKSIEEFTKINITIWTRNKHVSNMNTAMTWQQILAAQQTVFVCFLDITMRFAIHVWTEIVGNTKTISKLHECNHGSLLIFATFAVVRKDKFVAFDVRRCCVCAVFELCMLVWTLLQQFCCQ